MKREIKFRGKTDKGNWLYGSLGRERFYLRNELISTKQLIFDDVRSFNSDNYPFIINDLKVDEDTIGQYIGIKDKNGKEIYEGDIVLAIGHFRKKIPMEVRFECGAFLIGYHYGSSTRTTPILLNSKCEVIGNIYDNPELLND